MTSLPARLLATILILHGANAYGQAQGDELSSTTLLVQTLFGLALVLVAIYALAWIAKKLQSQGFNRSSHMQLLGAMPVGPKEKAVLIQVKGKSILLGVAAGNISALHVFDGEEQQPEPDNSTIQITSTLKGKSLSARSSSEFSKKLQTFLGQGKS